MEGYFFKARKTFDFTPHVFDLGIPFMQWTSHLDMHFLNKITEIQSDSHQSLYNYHLTYYLETVDNADEKLYFTGLLELITDELVIEKKQDRRKLNSNRKNRHEKRINQYKAFRETLKTLDKWGITFNLEDKINNQLVEKQLLESFINKQQNSEEYLDGLKQLTQEKKILTEQLSTAEEKIKNLEQELTKIRTLGRYKINIKKGYKGTVVQLLKDLKNLEDPETKNLILGTTAENTWAKILSNNFSDENKDISLETAENYFVKGLPSKPKPLKTNILIIK